MLFLRNERTWDPFKEWDQLFTNTPARQARPTQQSPQYVVQEKENGFILSLDVPGVRKEDIQIETKARTLTVTAKRKLAHGDEAEALSFHASFELPAVVQMEGAEASYLDGVLTLALPKVKEATSRTIKVSDGRGEFLGKLVQGFIKNEATA